MIGDMNGFSQRIFEELHRCSPGNPTSMEESHRRATKINSGKLAELFGNNPIVHNCLYHYIREQDITYEEALELAVQELAKVQAKLHEAMVNWEQARPVEILVKPEVYYTLTWRARFKAFWKAVTWKKIKK